MKQKTTFKERLFDSLWELLFGAIFLLIGFGVTVLFGGTPWDFDFEVLALIGVGVFVLIAAVTGVFIYLFKKRKTKK